MLSSFKSKKLNVFLPLHLWGFSNGVFSIIFLEEMRPLDAYVVSCPTCKKNLEWYLDQYSFISIWYWISYYQLFSFCVICTSKYSSIKNRHAYVRVSCAILDLVHVWDKGYKIGSITACMLEICIHNRWISINLI